MQLCHPIYTETIMNINMCHMHAVVFVNNVNGRIRITGAYIFIKITDNRN